MEVHYNKFVESYIEISLPQAKDKIKIKLKNMLCNTTPDVTQSVPVTILNTDLRPKLSNVTTS